ncbi:DUF5808 domain-containing protein [Clostridium sp. AL.422]|uniref:DUF1648 domain-containing protein n=1 Tax=Clostridium TaxID=1485 RepID=UPI00293DEAE3|nr:MULTISPECIES: DUF5808 domain-containing protein [unclassified Clostridium]MDV4149825.1 DUF5808 domain-containing protein [Clostridium sp. AL.422]
MEKVFLVGSTIFVSIFLFISTFCVNKFSNNGIIFGVRVPKEYEKDEDILKLEKEYKRNYLIFVLPIIFIINLLCVFISKISIFLLLTFALIIVTNIPIFIYWNKMMKLKEDKGWKSLGKNVVLVDTSIRKPKIREDNVVIKTRNFMLLLVIPLVTFILTLIAYKDVPNTFPIHYNAEGIADSFVNKEGFKGFFYLALFPVLYQAGMIIFLAIINKFAINGKVEINSGTLEEIKKQRKVFKRINSILLFIITIEITLMMAFIQICTIFSWNVKAINVVFLPIILITTIIFSVISYKIGQGGKNIKINVEDKEIYRDDDKNWIFGNFYYNKKDPSIFIEKRVGIGWDVNLGNPIGLIIMVLPFILIIVLVIYLVLIGV